MTGSVRFSVVIPTRDRAKTLKAAIQSCLLQDFVDYEVVVCDNNSSSDTQRVVEEFSAKSILYHRSPKSLSMAENWNLALSASNGEYVIYIGDDDALMPFALTEINLLLRETQHKAIRWESATYAWPDITVPEYANYLAIPMKRGLSEISSRQAITRALHGRAPGTILPNVYHGAVARSVLDEILNKNGRVFGSHYCDTYSSFAVAHQLNEWLSLDTPMSVMGFSGASSNISFNAQRRKSEVAIRYRAEHADSQVHRTIPDLPTWRVVLPSSFLAVKADLFPDDETLVLDRRVLIDELLRYLPIDTLDEWPGAIAEIRRSISDDSDLAAWFEIRLAATRPHTTPRDRLRPRFSGFGNGRLHLDVKKRGIVDVAQAAAFAAKILKADGKSLVMEKESAVSSLLHKAKIAKFLLEL